MVAAPIPRIVDGGRLPFSPIDLIDPDGSGPFNGGGRKSSSNRRRGGDRRVDRNLGSDDQDFASYLVDKNGNEYEPYSLAWRYLGMYVDCDIQDAAYNGNYDDFQRKLGSGDGDGCERILLWAAYHDPRYRGGQIGEYKFFDLSTREWDTSTCKTRRCARMDCHEPNTHFKLVGVFKETDGIVDWAEQLFKHEGYCIWDEDTYDEMQSGYERWTTSCTQLYFSDDDGNTLYLDMKPQAEGNVTMGIYLDESCSQGAGMEFGDYVLLYYNYYYGSSDRGYQAMAYWEAIFEYWNANMEIYKICQPCRAYNLNKYEEEESGSGSGSGDRRFLENENDGEGDEEKWGYDCYDDAGYTNVNQCYKFETKTDMEPAETDDLIRASQQGTILEIRVGNKVYGRGGIRSTPELFTFGHAVLAIFGLGVIAACFLFLKKRINHQKIRSIPASFKEAFFDNKDAEPPATSPETAKKECLSRENDNDSLSGALDPPSATTPFGWENRRSLRPFFFRKTEKALPNELETQASSQSHDTGSEYEAPEADLDSYSATNAPDYDGGANLRSIVLNLSDTIRSSVEATGISEKIWQSGSAKDDGEKATTSQSDSKGRVSGFEVAYDSDSSDDSWTRIKNKVLELHTGPSLSASRDSQEIPAESTAETNGDS